MNCYFTGLVLLIISCSISLHAIQQKQPVNIFGKIRNVLLPSSRHSASVVSNFELRTSNGAAEVLVAICLSVLCLPAYAGATTLDDATFQGQLSIIREKQRSDVVAKQKESLEAQEKLFTSCPLTTHAVIARGVVTLSPLIALENAGSSTIDPSKYPLGLPFATDIDSRFALPDRSGDSDPTPTLFLTAVGRDGPPLAAKKIRLGMGQGDASQFMFPLYVELTTADLLFPYSDEVWRQLPPQQRGDSISVTAVLDSDGQLAGPPSSADSFGFAISDAIVPEVSEPESNKNGDWQRRVAQVQVSFKAGATLTYSKEEKELLGRIDTQLAQKGFSERSPDRCK